MFNHVFKTRSVAELNTLHTTCEVEKTQLLTILAMSVKGSIAWLYDCHHHLATVYIAEQCYDNLLLCMLTLSLAELLNMLIIYYVKTTPNCFCS